jgi:poly(A) polymerase Pap1
MRARAVVELGSGRVRWLDGDQAEPGAEPAIGRLGAAGERPPDLDTLAEHVTRAVAAALPEATVHLAGSRRLGCELPGADLDLVAVLPRVDVGAVCAKLAAAVPSAERLRQVVGARVPGLRFQVGALSVDLVLVESGEMPGTPLSEAQATALSAITDAEAVLELAGRHPATFARVARTVKAWARARGLDSAPFGGLPGIAWSLLVARSVAEGGDLARFFDAQAVRDWHQPLWTPTPPHRDLAAQVGPGFRDLIADELYRAWELTERGAEDELTTPPPMHRRHAAWAVVTVEAASEPDFEALLGRVRGRMRSLVTALEADGAPDIHAWPHPFDAGPRHARYAIGLGREPLDAGRLRMLARSWERGLPGVSVVRRTGGEVPSL